MSRLRRRSRPEGSPRRTRRPLLPPRERRPARWGLIGWSAFLWVPALAVAGVLLGMTLSAQAAVSAYRDQDEGRGATTFAWLGQWAPMEQWKAPFDEGTARMADGQSPRLALFSLDRALRLVPEDARCDVQTNRAVVLSAVADGSMAEAADHVRWITELSRLRGAGEPVPEDAEWGDRTLAELVDAGQRLTESAQADYLAAAEALMDPACEDQRSDEEQQQAEDQAQQLEEQAGEAGEMGDQMNPNSGEGEGGEGGPTPEEQEQQRQQELQERNGGGDGGGSDPEGEDEGSGGGVERPW
ncbi:hypothetical protein [Cellulomonas denverensis]|uniref:DUF5667 domain-containing protein n=1 Tax=Cellulomonas denverensis TaxID=264297 RepID=A0A7X6QY45_9CELL|nr:hypothetical protein [Cellulomonas denverensis]NKY21745.1 hypothetical protein [Cellulomonas denverensis]GIG25596.1 hypothetical protein Cde04nite_18400 [Cellulomonas denverensis]